MASKKKKDNAEEVSFSGFVEEFESEDGEMGLQIDDGDEAYIIKMDENGRKLREYIDNEVEIIGLMTKTGKDRYLKVFKFEPVDDYYDDDDYDDGYYDADDDY